MLLAAALALAAAGCGRAAPEAHVLARVNGMQISLAALGATPAASLREALDKVIDRELLVQRALALGLDREPRVVAAIDAARRRILADAYLEQVAAGGATRDEARAFYAENGPLFAERRIYRLRELVVPAGAALVDGLRAEAARAASFDELAAWLRQREARFTVLALTQPAEELPLAYVPKLAGMKDGELAVFTRPPYSGFPGGASVVELEHAEAAPLSEAQALPAIERFLAGRRRLETAAAEVRRLRAAARIEYLGMTP